MLTKERPTHFFQHSATWLFLLLVIGCKEDEAFIPTQGTQLVAMEYSCERGNCLTTYSYNADGQLTESVRNVSLEVRYELAYQGDRLIEYTQLRTDTDTPLSRNSLLYNDDGLLVGIHEFDPQEEADRQLEVITEFDYDQNGLVNETRRLFVNPTFQTLIVSERIYWEGENVSRKEVFDQDDNLIEEYSYTYDDKLNPFQNLPDFIKDPVNWSINNVTSIVFTDYLGTSPINCDPCNISYEYNADDYPVQIFPDATDNRLRSKSILRYQQP